MKNAIAISCAALFAFVLLYTKGSAQKLPQKSDNTSGSALDGAWQRIYSYHGNTATTGEPKEFVIMYNDFFSSVGQDSTGRWNVTHAGAYEISGNTMKNSLRYSSHPERIGATHWVGFEVNGDTLTLRFFKKFITAQGQDLTAQMPKDVIAKYVRAKK